MINMELIHQQLIQKLGEDTFQLHIIEIADTLNDLSITKDGTEELIVNKVIDVIMKRVKYVKRTDVSQKYSTQSLDALAKDTLIVEDQIAHFEPIVLNSGSKKPDIKILHEKLQLLDWLEDYLKMHPDKHLTDIPSGKNKETMNDWLADLAGKSRDGRSEYLIERISAIRKISSQNHSDSSATGHIRNKVSQEELKSLNCRAICAKYKLDFASGTIRQFISRLKRKAIA